ncbi:hypothetical protein [Rhodoplanes sp. Z2-YC6860]|uniref:hypothetical protein n=1 Tax=Rhodoplanes sp. Z2-YC6860 TaxID=674703 RepID=UPI00082C62CE|nr:hypothetical protein [Rhodoplanes sp. Z2-YC6860]
MVTAIAPVLVIGRHDRIDASWKKPWPALLDRPAAVEPELAVLQRRIEASLERLLKSDSTTRSSEPL